MVELRRVDLSEVEVAMNIINTAKEHLKQQGIDQWQTGYPDYACIQNDALNEKGFFLVEGKVILGYLCIDYSGEPAYSGLKGKWRTDEKYVVVHRMAFTKCARGKGLSNKAFELVEKMSLAKNVHSFRVDTDSNNLKMKHILRKSGFECCGTICFDNSEKIAFEKNF